MSHIIFGNSCLVNKYRNSLNVSATIFFYSSAFGAINNVLRATHILASLLEAQNEIKFLSLLLFLHAQFEFECNDAFSNDSGKSILGDQNLGTSLNDVRILGR